MLLFFGESSESDAANAVANIESETNAAIVTAIISK
jgi:hypothetical protein